jgi:hypothetical protein
MDDSNSVSISMQDEEVTRVCVMECPVCLVERERERDSANDQGMKGMA